MIWSGILARAALLALAASPILAATPGNTNVLASYQSIIDRNPFDLKPPPEPAPVTNAAPAAPKSDIFLTGISTFVKPKRAYIMTKPAKGDPQYYNFTENEGKDGLEVLQIDEKSRTVRVRYAGEETLLSFATHSVKSPDSVPNPVLPANAQPGKPGMIVPSLPGGSVPYTPPAFGGNAMTSAAGNPAAGSVSSMDPALAARYGLPARTVRTAANDSSAGFTGLVPSRNARIDAPVSTPSPEEQILRLELQKQMHPNIPFPPTPGINQGGPPGPPGLPLPGR